jgi:hypothetical protein
MIYNKELVALAWILTSKEQPKEIGYYTCTVEDPITKERWVDMRYYANGRWDAFVPVVIAWLDTPAPYKGEA